MSSRLVVVLALSALALNGCQSTATPRDQSPAPAPRPVVEAIVPPSAAFSCGGGR